MNYAFMSFSCPELTLDEMLSTAKRFGYDGIEPRIVSGHKHGVEVEADAVARREIKQKAIDSGIALCCVATSCTYADPATKQEKIDETLRCIDLAGDVEAPCIRVFGGVIPDDVSREKAIDLVAEALQSVSKHASERGVIVCMETHDHWCDPAHVAKVMKRVNHTAIGVNWDIMHPVRVVGATIDQAYETLKPWIRHVHFHDGVTVGDNLELVPIGEGEIDHRRTVELLKAGGFQDFLSGEWIGWDQGWEIHLPRELATMKRYEAQAS